MMFKQLSAHAMIMVALHDNTLGSVNQFSAFALYPIKRNFMRCVRRSSCLSVV